MKMNISRKTGGFPTSPMTAHARTVDPKDRRRDAKELNDENHPGTISVPVRYNFGDVDRNVLPLRELKGPEQQHLDDSRIPYRYHAQSNPLYKERSFRSSSEASFPSLRRCHSTPSSTDSSSLQQSGGSPLESLVLAEDHGCYPEYYEDYEDDDDDDDIAQPVQEPRFPTHESYLRFLEQTFAGSDLFSQSGAVVQRVEAAYQQENTPTAVVEFTGAHDTSHAQDVLVEEFRKESMLDFLDSQAQDRSDAEEFRKFLLSKGKTQNVDDETDHSSHFDPDFSVVESVDEDIDSIQYTDESTFDHWDAFANDSSAEVSLAGDIVNQKSDTRTESTHVCSPASDDSRAATGIAESSCRSIDISDPLRNERSLEEQLDSLTVAQRACVSALKTNWEESQGGSDVSFPEMYYLRFARCSPGRPFDYKAAMGAMKRFRKSYLDLSISRMANQLLTKTLFPIPGLRSKVGYHVLYMRPSRFFPTKSATKLLTGSLVYAIQSMQDREEACTKGIGLVANMTGFRKANFSFSFYRRFMKLLEGRHMPVRVQMVLLVNPPDWFGNTMLKLLASREVRQKIRIISFDEVEECLMDDCADLLPDELGGKRETADVVREFIVERQAIERKKPTGYEV